MADSSSNHPLDIMPAWAWLFVAVLLLGVTALFGLAGLDIYEHTCTTNHAVCANRSP